MGRKPKGKKAMTASERTQKSRKESNKIRVEFNLSPETKKVFDAYMEEHGFKNRIDAFTKLMWDTYQKGKNDG